MGMFQYLGLLYLQVSGDDAWMVASCCICWLHTCVCTHQVASITFPGKTADLHLTSPICGLAASILAGILISRIKPHWIMLISMCAFFIGSLFLATAPVGQSYWLNTFFGILIMPFVRFLLFPHDCIGADYPRGWI